MHPNPSMGAQQCILIQVWVLSNAPYSKYGSSAMHPNPSMGAQQCILIQVWVLSNAS